MREWYIAPLKVSVSAGSGDAAITPMTGTFASAEQVANSIYDNNYNLVFYIADNNIYNASHVSIGGLANYARTTEIVVVPYNCDGGKYYLFYMACDPTGLIFLYKTIVNMTTSTVTSSLMYTYSNVDCGGLAAGNLTTSGKRYLYAVYGSGFSGSGKIDRITINPDNSLSASTNIVTGNSTPGFGSGVDFATAEVDLSHDGTKLAWVGLGNTVYNRAYRISLDASGNYVSSSLAPYTYGLTGQTEYAGRGIEFNADGTKLYAGGLNGIYQLTGTNASLTTAIAGTGSYGRSQLEMGKNGYIYAVNSVQTHIIGINPTANSLSTPILLAITPNLPNPPYEGQAGFLTLPDQIDGFDYNTQVSPFNAVTHNATTQTWTSGGNPWSASVVRIGATLTVPSGVTLTIRNMTVEFGLGATLNVQSGGVLKLESATLQAACPLSMWQGVVVSGTGKVSMDDFSGNAIGSKIYDAIRGIDASGSSAEVDVIDYSLFDRNERHIFITSGSASINSFTKSTFNHTTQLKDQARGQDQSGGSGTPRYGITSIELLNTINAQNIGTTGVGLGNTFNEGQYGIYGVNSNFNVYRNTFNTLRTRGVFANGTYQNRTVNITNYNTFNGNKTAIDAHYGVFLTVQSNTFNNGYEHGLLWAYNNGADLKVGDINTTSFGNTFNYQNWSAIFTNDNAHATTTQITIARNTIQNSSYAYGILVQETSLASTNTYKEMFVSNNTITNIDYGIVLTNIKGYIGQQDPLLADPQTNTLKVQYNVINQFGVNRTGILGGNSPRIRTTNNEVYTTNNTIWGNAGISFLNGYEGLIAQNTCKSAAGIIATLNMLNANIACNSLQENQIGIDLISEQLRSLPTQTHGVVGGQDRRNFFVSMLPGSWDIKLDNTSQANNKWVDPNTTDPRIDYSTALLPFPGNSIIVTGGTTSPCYNTIISGGGENGLSGEESGLEEQPISSTDFEDVNTRWLVDYMLQSQQYETGANFANTENTFIPQLLVFENYFSNGDFESATEVFQQFNPQHPFELNLKEVYEVALGYRTEEIRKLYDAEIERLVAVASQHPRDGGPAVFSARAILKFKENMDFTDKYDAPPYNISSESNKTDETNTIEAALSKLKVYPNPAENELTVETPEKGLYLVTISNAFGQNVFAGSFNSTINKINTSELRSGIYLVQVINQETNSMFLERITIK